MQLRERISTALKEAMRNKDTLRLSTLRLITAAIKDREIAARGEAPEGTAIAVGEAEIVQILSKMVKQRQESARAYEEAGRLELAGQELEEIGVIEGFLPRQLTDDEVEAAIAAVIAETGASGLRDMGRVMGALKEKYTGRMDFGAAGATIKARLG